MDDFKWTSKKDIKKLIELIKGKFEAFDKSKLSVSGGIGNNAAIPLEIINNGNDETAIGFRNKGVNLGNINFNVNMFQIFSNNLDGIKSKQILVISNGARAIYDYKSGTLKEILVQGDINVFQPGEVVTIPKDEFIFSGLLTSGSKSIVFTIPLSKDITGRNVKVEYSGLEIRCNGKYLTNGGLYGGEDSSAHDLYLHTNGNLLSIRFNKKDLSVWSDVNNTLVEIDGNFTITFS